MESGLGETISETRSGFRGAALVLSQTRDQAGRLKAQDLPEGHRLVYEYSPVTGRILRTGHDLNRNGNIDLASLDRVSETRESYTRDPGNGPWYRVTESIAYLQSGAATPTVLSTTKEQLTGFTGNVVARRIMIGASGQATTYTTTMDRAAKTRTESIQRPGVAGAETRVFVNGALRSESTPGQSGTVTYTYDGLGRIATVAHPATGTTTYQYRGAGTLVESITNHLGHVTRYAYYTSGPLAGQVQTITNPEGETVTYSYDLQNRKVSESGTGTYPVTKIYNEEGQMTELHTFRNNLTTPDITKWHYDAASGLLEAKEYADHSTLAYTYDAAGRLTSRTWARGVRTIYAYDPVSGDLKSISYSDGTPGVTFTTRDRLGRIDTLTDAIGTQNLDFDPEGTLTSHAYTDGALAGIALTIGRDGLGRRSGLSVARNGNTIHSVAEGYEQFGRSSTHSFGGRTISYGYDPARGLRTQTQFPSGVTTTTTYDSAGRISSVLSAKNGQILAGRTYPVIDKANRRRQIGEPDGSLWTFDYNQRGEVTRGEKQNAAGNLLDGHRFTYQYDHIGNRITATTGAPDLVASYATNALNEYTQIATPQTEFVRGTAQGAASVAVNGQAVPLGTGGTFNARVTTPGPATIVATAADGSTSTETRTVALPPPTFAPQYDADGNLLNDGLWTYTWDGENRLIALESTPTNPMPERIFKRFTYDFQSRRISEERHVFDPAAGSGGAGAYVLEKAIRWVNDGWNQSVELLNDRPIRAYVWGLDLSGTRKGAGGVGGLLSSVDLLDGSASDYVSDGNGNVVVLADAVTGGVMGTYKYDPFGEELAMDGPAARVNRFRFSCKVADVDSSLINYGYRNYLPANGRWLSRDPVQERGGLNLHAFTENQTLGAIDYLGLQKRIVVELSVQPYAGVDAVPSNNNAERIIQESARARAAIFPKILQLTFDGNGVEGALSTVDCSECVEELRIRGHGIDPDKRSQIQKQGMLTDSINKPGAKGAFGIRFHGNPKTPLNPTFFGLDTFPVSGGEKFCKPCKIVLFGCYTGDGEAGRLLKLEIARITGCSVNATEGVFYPLPDSSLSGNIWDDGWVSPPVE